MYQQSQLRSIGHLACADGSIKLTPVFNGNIYPTIVHITSIEWEAVRGNIELMKSLALERLNKHDKEESRFLYGQRG